MRVIPARQARAPATDGLPSATDGPLQRSELAKSAITGNDMQSILNVDVSVMTFAKNRQKPSMRETRPSCSLI